MFGMTHQTSRHGISQREGDDTKKHENTKSLFFLVTPYLVMGYPYYISRKFFKFFEIQKLLWLFARNSICSNELRTTSRGVK